MKKVIGVLLCLLPFLALFTITWVDYGFLWALGLYVSAFGITALMWVGVKLVCDN